MRGLILSKTVERKIYAIRGYRVMFDVDLAKLYGVSTKRLNEQVRRNKRRFPDDFMFELREEEVEILRSQIATSSWGGRRYMPLVFTEQGVAMLSGVLHSARAIRVNIAIMRAFVKLREIFTTHKELAHQLSELEKRFERHDDDIAEIFKAIQQLMEAPPEKPKREIGFHVR